MRKIFFKNKLGAISLSFLLAVNSYGASPLIVSDPELLASQGTAIEKMVDSIAKYEQMISNGIDQINRLNQITDVLNATQRFISGSALKIASPFQVIETLKNNLEGIYASYKKLEKTIKEYDWRDHIKTKRLQGKCPWLRFDLIGTNDLTMFFNQTGEETPIMKDAKQLFELLADDTYANMSSVVGALSGRALGEFLCETAIEEQERKALEQNIALQKRAILDGNFEEHERLRIEGMKESLKRKIKEEERMKEKWQPLINRNTQMLQSLGVTDKTANNNPQKIPYCEEGQNPDTGEAFCYPLLLRTTHINHKLDKLEKKLMTDLTTAGTDTDLQAQAYSDYSQEAERISLEYAKNQAESLNFLNETMSLMASLMAEEYKRKYQTLNTTPVNNKSFQTEDQILEQTTKGDLMQMASEKPPLNKFGFPTLDEDSASDEEAEASF